MAAFSSFIHLRLTRYFRQAPSRLLDMRDSLQTHCQATACKSFQILFLKGINKTETWLSDSYACFSIVFFHTSAHQTLLKEHMSFQKLLLPKITQLKSKEAGKGNTTVMQQMCWKGGITKSFISPTFIQKDKSLVTLNSQLKNSVVWLNHKAVWWTKSHGTTLTYYLKI